MNYNLFTKEETLNFIDLFEESTCSLDQPMISWLGYGAYELPEAMRMVEEGFTPKGIVVYSKHPKDGYWDFVRIFKYDNKYVIKAGAFINLSDTEVELIPDALQKACTQLKQVVRLRTTNS